MYPCTSQLLYSKCPQNPMLKSSTGLLGISPTAGNEWQVSEWSFICVCSSSNVPITTIHSPTPCLPSFHGKTVFHATSPSCLKGWGLLLYSRPQPTVTRLPLTPCPSPQALDLEEWSVSVGPSEANPDTGTGKQHSPRSSMWSEHPLNTKGWPLILPQWKVKLGLPCNALLISFKFLMAGALKLPSHWQCLVEEPWARVVPGASWSMGEQSWEAWPLTRWEY